MKGCSVSINQSHVLISRNFLCADLPPSAFRAACYLLAEETHCYFTQGELAVELGMAPSTLTKAIKDLGVAGYLRVEVEPGTRRRRFVISDEVLS